MLKILVSNDDGIHSPGIFKLAKSLSNIGKVIVVAPESEQSATSQAITMHKPLRSNKINSLGKDIDAWSINGTPSDCVKFALESLLEEKPDLVVSGINKGSNLGTDVFYSGTVSAAIEGAIKGIPSIALSLCCNEKCNFYEYANLSSTLCKQLYENGIGKNIAININFPNIPLNNINGVKITKLGTRVYKNCFIERKDPRGKTYFWLGGEIEEVEEDYDSDVSAINNNFISVTPIKIDLTSYEYVNKMKEWDLELK